MKYLVQFLAAVCQMLNKIIWWLKRDDFTTCLMYSFPKCWNSDTSNWAPLSQLCAVSLRSCTSVLCDEYFSNGKILTIWGWLYLAVMVCLCIDGFCCIKRPVCATARFSYSCMISFAAVPLNTVAFLSAKSPCTRSTTCFHPNIPCGPITSYWKAIIILSN